MLDGLRNRIARWLVGSQRTYAGGRVNRLNFGFGSTTTSADSELKTSLPQLRNRSRQLVRDAAYAGRAHKIVVDNVIGSGIGMQAQVMNTRDKPRHLVNTAIENAWREWTQADSCHTGGALHFCDLERAAMGQVFDAGEVFIREHPRAFGQSAVPLALELIEAERIADEYAPAGPLEAGNQLRMGIEVDQFFRPVAYYIRQRHPGDIRMSMGQVELIERVPAAQIFHLKLTDRWPQVRGEPWMHAVINKLNDMDEYSGAELVAARASANYFATVESNDENPLAAVDQADGSRQMELEAGLLYHMPPGQKLNFHSPNRPNSALSEFMRHLLREVATGVGVPYASLSADYSQTNYSSSRLALIDERDHWRTLQQWWIRSFRQPLHRRWISQAVLARAIPAITVQEFISDPSRYQKVMFKPRGWGWVDPTKEVNAYKEAIKAGFTTVGDVIASTGGGQDLEDVLDARKRELEMFAEAGIEVDTTVKELQTPAPVPPALADPPEVEDEDEVDPEDEDNEDPPARVFAFGRS
jgi:lambda family phage portal protein